MGVGRGADPAERPEPVRADRLRLLAALDKDSTDSDVLMAAVQHVTVELGGLGAMAYLRARSEAWDLQLLESAGLPQAFVRLWYNVFERQASRTSTTRTPICCGSSSPTAGRYAVAASPI
jgi:hypothetical protein